MGGNRGELVLVAHPRLLSVVHSLIMSTNDK